MILLTHQKKIHRHQCDMERLETTALHSYHEGIFALGPRAARQISCRERLVRIAHCSLRAMKTIFLAT